MKIEKVSGFTTGIKCDLCASEREGDFTYYSMDDRYITVVKNVQHQSALRSQITFSFDVCDVCMASLVETVKVNYAPVRAGVNCDLCSGQLRGDFTYHYLTITEVIVSMSKGSLKCAGCGMASNGVCKCGVNGLLKTASVLVNEGYLQMTICDKDFDRLATSASVVRQGVNNG